MLEQQLSAATKGKEEKIEENKHILEEIAKLEEENKTLEEEIRRLDEEIAGLDEEFKAAQIDAGRLRREIKISTEKAENERKKSADFRNQIARLEKTLETLKREIKQEIDDRRSLEARLRKTNAHIDAMKTHRLAAFVTRQLEKQDWYLRQEEPDLSYDDEEDEVKAAAAIEAAPVEAEKPAEEAPPAKSDEEEEEGIDFSMN